MLYLRKYKGYIIVIAAALLLMGCKEHNPLLGEWSLIKTPEITSAAFRLAQVSGNAKIIFEEERLVSGTKSKPVSYSVNENEVTVHYTKGDASIYTILDDRYFLLETVEEGIFKYVRVKKPEVL